MLRGADVLLGAAPCIRRVRELIERAGPTDQPVLLSGEIGTGKKNAARAIHEASGRAGGPFVALHRASLVDSAFESALFGHEPGAFSGAVARRDGRLRQADGGTLFVDEVAGISPGTQARLLRFLRHGELQRVGGDERIRADVRLIAATQRDLRAEVAAGRFCEALSSRLHGVHIPIPPLRERPGDIPLLAAALLARLAAQYRRPIAGLTPEALELLLSHAWPGNVRELERAIEGAVVLVREGWIGPQHLAALGRNGAFELEVSIPGSTLAEIERIAILRTLAAVDGSTSRAAAMLGISPRKIQYRMREYRQGRPLGFG